MSGPGKRTRAILLKGLGILAVLLILYLVLLWFWIQESVIHHH
jgi:uncharacterized RDD family membrane protein YckC